jgi:hypothetical protein
MAPLPLLAVVAGDTPPSTDRLDPLGDPLEPSTRRLVQRIAKTTARSWAPIPPAALSVIYPAKEEQTLFKCLSAPDMTVGASKPQPLSA